MNFDSSKQAYYATAKRLQIFSHDLLSCGHRNPDPDGIGDPWTLTGDCPGLPDGRTGLILRWLRGLDGWFDPEVIVRPLFKRQLSLILFDLVNSIKTKGNG